MSMWSNPVERVAISLSLGYFAISAASTGGFTKTESTSASVLPGATISNPGSLSLMYASSHSSLEKYSNFICILFRGSLPAHRQEFAKCNIFIRCNNYPRISIAVIHLINKFPTSAAGRQDAPIPIYSNYLFNSHTFCLSQLCYCCVFGTKAYTARSVDADTCDDYSVFSFKCSGNAARMH